MNYKEGKQKSFLQSFTWIGIFLLALGAIFLGVAVVIQLIPINPESITVYSNGVRQPPTGETVKNFRLIFLLVFGINGLVLSIAGVTVAVRAIVRRKLNLRLKEEGICLTAEVLEYAPSAMSVNNRRLVRLHCVYTVSDGRTYIFKSGLLRMDPMPYLHQRQVNVYHDIDNIHKYFVDIDGSVGLGVSVIEL